MLLTSLVFATNLLLDQSELEKKQLNFQVSGCTVDS